MRFKYNNKRPDDGESRTVSHFAWLPVKCIEEMRWLEFVTYTQVFHYEQMDWVNYYFH